MRIALGIEYKGTQFSGWQSQAGARTVQDCVELALGRVADRPVRVAAAGRTDAGVHAGAQVIHFDTDVHRPGHSWVRGGNSHLPHDVRILWARSVPDRFHARFSALERAYRYVIYAARTRPAILDGLCTWVYYDLSLGSMQEALDAVPGTHDFSAFRAAGCQAKSPVRTVSRCEISQSGPWLWLDIRADAFLQHMVRNLVGTLLLIGRGERPVAWLGQVLAGKDRRSAGPCAPPAGLYLMAVRYPPQLGIPAPASAVRFW